MSSGLNSFHVVKDDSTEQDLLELETLSPTTRKKKFDHFKFGRSNIAAAATGEGGVAGSILVTKRKSLSRNLLSTKHTATTVTATDVPVPTPVATVENDLVPSPLSMMHWPILPEVVMIPDLPKYIPDDDFGRNAKRNEKYARIRLVALREHQQVLVGLLGDLLALDQQHREQQLVFKDPAHLVGKAAVTSPSWKRQSTPGSALQSIAVLMASSSKDLKATETEAGEAGCGCDCQKRRRRQLQKHDSATRTYQRAILDLWQSDENLCHWLSRYIRTTRHVGRGLDYILATMAEDNNNSTYTGSITSSSPFKYPVTLDMTQEIGTGSRGVRVGISGNERPASGVSNPELERMGILQSRLLGHSSTSLSMNDDSTGNSECQAQHMKSEALISSEFIMESATLGIIDIELSTSMHPPEQRIPIIEEETNENEQTYD
ncbi:hypothetical protein BGZ96_007649 [Linnemannia gamsii]|uniref:Uncharacterized protein n=1 Tax=Linnemannia gamsii TaxID=64522 RepID=A0ABQ7KIJ4_9FUNG|nr:hypothetical protein BGZ96_007649 [Linnemannia gamsii]